MPSLTILVPVKNRPQNVQRLCESAADSLDGVEWYLWFANELNDPREFEAIKEAIAERPKNISMMLGEPDKTYAEKINFLTRWTFTDMLFLAADDLRFHEGWYQAALEKMEDGIKVVGTNDLCNPAVMKGQHATHFLVKSDYVTDGTIDERGKLLHEGYQHEWVDNEFIETAKARQVYAHAGESVVEHLHPMVGKAPSDELYAGMPERMQSGGKLFLQRRKLWT